MSMQGLIVRSQILEASPVNNFVKKNVFEY